MTGNLSAWTPDDSPGEILVVTSEGDWDFLRHRYSPGHLNEPLESVITLAREHNVQSVVIEKRYIDRDYRSQHSHFYGATFTQHPSVCHRLHFFTNNIEDQGSNLGDSTLAYRGYSVMRPLPTAPVGRTMIPPPPSLTATDAQLCLARDDVHLWGHTFKVDAMPFISQDTQYLRCAHASLWMILHHLHLRHGLTRRLPHEIHISATGGSVIGRQLPSDGLSPGQVLNSLAQLGIQAPRIPVATTREESRGRRMHGLFPLVARYVNSQLPPLVYSQSHAWVIVGYRRSDPAASWAHDNVTLIRHDDARGLYLIVEDPWKESIRAYKPWKSVIPPLPEQVYLSAERVELLGQERLEKRAKALGAVVMNERLESKKLVYRTYACRSHAFKSGTHARLPEEVASLYCLTHMPRWVWVVEAHDRDLLDLG